MTDKAPPVHWNSPVIAKAAEKAGLPINEFIEMCVLQIIRVQEIFPGEFTGEGNTPWERLERLRFAVNFYEKYKQLTPENKAFVQSQFPDFQLPNNPEE